MPPRTTSSQPGDHGQLGLLGATSRDVDVPYKTIRIAVSGDVVLTRLEVNVVDTRQYQRLRALRQLGASHIVYPSANHTRFEHSLGVLRVTEDILRFVRANVHSTPSEREVTPEQERIARLAALLHDIANIPFGHTLEDETMVLASSQEDTERLERYLGPDAEIGRVLHMALGFDQTELLKKTLTAKKGGRPPLDSSETHTYLADLGENAFLVDIIHNTVCADLLDYLARDTYFCGIPLAVPDRFLRYLFLYQNDAGVKRLAIRLWKDTDTKPKQAVVTELIQLLETRYLLAERVYFHHAKQIASAMLAAATWHAMHQDRRPLSLETLSELGDEELLFKLSDKAQFPVASRIINALNCRQLYDVVYTLTRQQAEEDHIHDSLGYLKARYHADAALRASKEAELCHLAGLELGDVIIYCPDPDMNLKLAEMNVTAPSGVAPFQEACDALTRTKIDTIISSHKQLWSLQVFVRGGDQLPDSKRDLLCAWCDSYFRDHDGLKGEIARRQAWRHLAEDILRGRNLPFSADVHEEILQEAMAAKREGPQAREFLERLIDSRLAKQ